MTPFAASLRWHRTRAGLTQEALAARSGASVSHIARCEGGRVHRPGEGTLRSLADALGVPAGALLEPPPAPERAADDLAPVGPAAKSCPHVPSPPVTAGQGDRPPPPPPEADAAAEGPDVAPEGAVGREVPRAPSGVRKTLAERQREQLKAIRAARSQLAKDRRNRRARPWVGRSPLDGASGVRVNPPSEPP